MNFIKDIFLTIKSSFYDAAFYREVPSSYPAFKALALIGAILAILISIPAGIALHTLAKSDFSKYIVDAYPMDLVITIKDGVASADVPQPYSLKAPQSWSDATSSSPLAIIDTRPDLTVDELSKYNAPLVLTRTSLITHSDTQTRVTSLDAIKELTIDRALATKIAAFAVPFFRIAMYVLPFFVFMFVIMGYLLYYAFLGLPSALIVKFIARVKGTTMPFGAAYRTAMYGLIPASLASLAIGALGLGHGSFFALVVFILVIANNLQKPAAVPTP